MSTMPDQSPAAAAAPLPLLRLKRGEDRRLRSGHLWVFSNEIDNDATPLTGFATGAMVRLHSDRDQFLGYAYVNPPIAVLLGAMLLHEQFGLHEIGAMAVILVGVAIITTAKARR